MSTALEPEISLPAAASHPNGPHVVPAGVLVSVFVILIALTGLTVTATRIDLGSWNMHLALGIATIKGALVALYFMHLRYDRPLNLVVFLGALLFLAILLSFTLLDTQQYQKEIRAYELANPPAAAPAVKP